MVLKIGNNLMRLSNRIIERLYQVNKLKRMVRMKRIGRRRNKSRQKNRRK